jgi:ABC-type glycerol-3-phosphate transport system substrate-binding protein
MPDERSGPGSSSAGLDWQFGQSESASQQQGFSFRPWLALLSIAGLLVLVIIGWQLAQRETRRLEERRIERVQQFVDLASGAMLTGDGDLFFALQAPGASWQAALLSPENQAVFKGDPIITRARERDNEIWANISWSGNGERWQRVIFLRQDEGRLQFLPTSPNFWGDIRRFALQSEELTLQVRMFEADSEWAREVGGRALQTLLDLCPRGRASCPAERLPEVITFADNLSPTAAPGEITVPSPRLVALDEQGQPAEPFWEKVTQALEAYVLPVNIRFAVPGELIPDYQRLADLFAETQSQITVELVNLDRLEPDPAAWPDDIDGAALTPTVSMLARGLVFNLSPFINTDPVFDQADFYQQIWQGSSWRGQIWYMPQAASMSLLYFDAQALEQAGVVVPPMVTETDLESFLARALPAGGIEAVFRCDERVMGGGSGTLSLQEWNWNSLDDMIGQVAQSLPAGTVEWAFLDRGLDSVFARAFSYDEACRDRPSACMSPMEPIAIARALDYYRGLVFSPKAMPIITHLSDADRDFRVTNLISPRRVAIWLDEPVRYESHRLRQPLCLAPLPGFEDGVGVTPLWVKGNFIAQQSRYPRATWQWLTYLSYQPLQRQKRYVPARPSVAQEIAFWDNLPQPVGDIMRLAFPNARPVTVEEYELITWDHLGAVVSGSMTPEEAAVTGSRLTWFGEAGEP